MPKSAIKILTIHLYLFLGTVAKIYSFFLLCGYGFSYIFAPGKAKKAIQSLSQIQNAPITALVLILTFWAHPEWSPTAKIIYMAVICCILVLGYTCVNLPYGTLCGAMTQDIDERAALNSSRSVSAMMAIGVINIVTVPLISWFGAGNTKYGYLAVAVLYGIIFSACHLFCFHKTKEVVEVPVAQKLPSTSS